MLRLSPLAVGHPRESGVWIPAGVYPVDSRPRFRGDKLARE